MKKRRLICKNKANKWQRKKVIKNKQRNKQTQSKFKTI